MAETNTPEKLVQSNTLKVPMWDTSYLNASSGIRWLRNLYNLNKGDQGGFPEIGGDPQIKYVGALVIAYIL